MRYEQAAFEMAVGTAAQLPAPDGPEIVFSGRSNVGKSSLINKLVNRKALARTSANPGKTGTINFYRVGGVRFVDLPGYGYAKVSRQEKLRWASLVEGYFQGERPFSLVLQIVDMRHPPTADDLHMLDFLRANGFPFAIVLTKSDKLNKTEFATRLQALRQELADDKDIAQIPFSAVNGEGLEAVKEAINTAVELTLQSIDRRDP